MFFRGLLAVSPENIISGFPKQQHILRKYEMVTLFLLCYGWKILQ